MRSRTSRLLSLALSLSLGGAVVGPALVARAQVRPMLPPSADEQMPPSPNDAAAAAPGAPSAEQPDPPGGPVPQRRDGEQPRRRRAPAVAPPTAARATVVETASTTPAAPSRAPAPPVSTKPLATPTQVEQLVQRSSSAVDFFEMVDDMIDEVARQISREDPNLLSPMAIRLVRLSSNLRPEFARTLESRLIARIVNASNVKLSICTECTAMRSRVENGSWVLTVGTVRQEDMKRLGETAGIKTFMDVDFTYNASAGVIWMQTVAFRASDGGVVWTDAYRSDATMASLLRTGNRIPSRTERAADLEQKLSARPSYGYAASLGMAQLGYAGPTGNITGASASLRFHERFGENQSSLFGLSAGIFTTGPPSQDKQPQALNTILLGAYYSYNLSRPNLNRPEAWIYGEGGAVFSGNQGNTFYLESGVDTHLKWRMSLAGGLMYVFPTKYSGYDLGGVGFRLRVAMNW